MILESWRAHLAGLVEILCKGEFWKSPTHWGVLIWSISGLFHGFSIFDWLVVWNICSPYIWNNHPIWLIFFRGGWNHQPVEVGQTYCLFFFTNAIYTPENYIKFPYWNYAGCGPNEWRWGFPWVETPQWVDSLQLWWNRSHTDSWNCTQSSGCMMFNCRSGLTIQWFGESEPRSVWGIHISI